jgi:phage shock protein PspC (stress-responsive transcriptional regulator)
MVGVADGLDLDPTDRLVNFYEILCTVCKMHRFAATATYLITNIRVHLNILG